MFKKAQQYEQGKIKMLTKIRNSISNNPITKKIKSETSCRELVTGHSPPQRETDIQQTP